MPSGVDPERLRRNTDHTGIEVQPHQPISFQPRLVPDKVSGRGRRPTAHMIALALARGNPLTGKQSSNGTDLASGQREPLLAGFGIDTGDLELLDRRRRAAWDHAPRTGAPSPQRPYVHSTHNLYLNSTTLPRTPQPIPKQTELSVPCELFRPRLADLRPKGWPGSPVGCVVRIYLADSET